MAQFCEPTFLNGCFNWHSMAVSAGSINWVPGADDCSISDYTAQSTSVNAGDALAMTVENGVWSGCAVWVDLDNSGSFEDSENMFTQYAGDDPSHIYSFNITIPMGTPAGDHRMRVISPWGSDGVTVGDNGYGPCGNFQYGNFNDFTLTVLGAQGISEEGTESSVTIANDGVSGVCAITSNSVMQQLLVMDAQGRLMHQQRLQGDRATFETQAWPAGVYVLRIGSEAGSITRRIVVQ